MNNTMIQNSIAQRKAGMTQTTARRANGQVDYRNLQVGARPYQAKGRLVQGSIFDGVTDTINQVKYVGKGIKGEASDHQLGQVNDLAMKVGSLGIATYLATKRTIPVKKGMEFVGAGTFFATMAMWPKLAIQAPIQLMHGFNVNQKWEDSYGRKKDLLRDPQYFPPDIMGAEKMEKIGDRMGVDKNMKNRQKLIQDKMQKTAIQANTLWMLTAGFATPVIGALLASAIEKPLGKMIEAHKTKQVDKKLDNVDSIVESKLNNNATIKKVDKYLDEIINKEADDKFYNNVAKALSSGIESNDVEQNILKDIKTIVKDANKEVDVVELFEESNGSDAFNFFGVTKEGIAKNLQEKGINQKLDITNETNKAMVMEAVDNIYTQGIEDARSAGKSKKEIRQNKQVFSSLVNQALTTKPESGIVDKNVAEKIKTAAKAVESYKARRGVVTDVTNHYLNNEDSLKATAWKRVTNQAMNALGFSTEDLRKSMSSTENARKIMDEKLTALAKDDAKYEKAFNKVAKLVNDFDEKFLAVEGKVKPQLDKAADDMKKSGLANTVEYVAGKGANAHTNITTGIKNGVNGARASLYKILHGMDLYRNIEKGNYKKAMKNKPEEHVKKVENAMKRSIMDAGSGDHVTKLDIVEPKVYEDFMNLLYYRDGQKQMKFEKTTEEALKDVGGGKLKKNLYKHFELFSAQVGNYEYAFKPQHKLDVPKNLSDAEKHLASTANDAVKESMLGDTLASLTKGTSGAMYNTKKWTKMFGRFAIGLTAATVIAPVFFGKIKVPNQEVNTQNGGAR